MVGVKGGEEQPSSRTTGYGRMISPLEKALESQPTVKIVPRFEVFLEN